MKRDLCLGGDAHQVQQVREALIASAVSAGDAGRVWEVGQEGRLVHCGCDQPLDDGQDD